MKNPTKARENVAACAQALFEEETDFHCEQEADRGYAGVRMI